MNSLVLDSVTRDFGGLTAVNQLSLEVPPGCITGLIGPNGAGKTTVVNMITGLLKLTSGAIRFGDQDISRIQPDAVARLGIARTFQNVRLLNEVTVQQNVLSGFYRLERSSVLAQAFRLPSVRSEESELVRRSEALLKEFGISELSGRLAGGLAYGHQRRVEIMRALASDPNVLLLDEPVAGMNDHEAFELGKQIRKLAQKGLAILLIEHNIRFVTNLCDTLYVLSSGELICKGTPSEVTSNQRVIDAYLGG